MSGKDFEHMGRLGALGIREAMDQVRAGQTIPAEDVEAWVESWDTPNELPKPVPRRR